MRRKKNDVDKLFEELNSYHENIKLMLEVNSTKFLDTDRIGYRKHTDINASLH